MKFVRTELIEKIKQGIAHKEAEHERLKQLWHDAEMAAQEDFKVTQREELDALLIRLQGLRDNAQLWDEKAVKKAIKGRTNYSGLPVIDYLHYAPRGHKLTLADGTKCVFHQMPVSEVEGKELAILRLLESTEDEYVTTSGLESMGFRNIAFLWN